jgi:hypothetical protein
MLPEFNGYRQRIYVAGKIDGKKWELVRGLEDKHELVASDMPHRVSTVHDFPGDEGRLFFYADPAHQVGGDLYGIGKPHDRFGMGKTFSNHVNQAAVERAICNQIRGCDFLIAYIDTPDAFGTIAEIAYASACGIPCHVFLNWTDPKYRFERDPEAFPDALETNPQHDATFENIPQEPVSDLFVLCAKCHWKFHRTDKAA